MPLPGPWAPSPEPALMKGLCAEVVLGMLQTQLRNQWETGSESPLLFPQVNSFPSLWGEVGSSSQDMERENLVPDWKH